MNTNNFKKIGEISLAVKTKNESVRDEFSSVYGYVDMYLTLNDGKRIAILDMCDLGNLDSPDFGDVDSCLKDDKFVSFLVEDADLKGKVKNKNFSDLCYKVLDDLDTSYDIYEDVDYCTDPEGSTAWFVNLRAEYVEFNVFKDENGKFTLIKK